jgi:glycerate kinase
VRFLVAPDKFKRSLTAASVAQQIALGLREALPTAEITTAAVADGGEGTADVICRACGGEWVGCNAHDSLGRAIDARYVWLRDRATAVIEMSEAAGLSRIASAERDPVRASTFGVGEMMNRAIESGATHIIVGLGGSATTDGGFGMARAFGYKFYDTEGGELGGAVSDLLRLARMRPPAPLYDVKITGAVDVQNPLVGRRGAPRVFGSQKGATAEQIELLESALTRLADLGAHDLGCDYRDVAGAGAAGGLGFGLVTFCSAELRSGFDIVAEAIELQSKIEAADVVITGEGCLDAQTAEGKAPAGVARLARDAGKRVFAIVGSVGTAGSELFDDVYPLTNSNITVDEAIARAPELLRERARELAVSLSRR